MGHEPPDHVVIALLATDGQPTVCTVQSASGLAQIAADGANGTPSVKTFTIGVFEAQDKPGGPNVVNAIAAAGGTQQAFVIDASNPNVQAEFLKALNSIRGSALGCQYKIPETDAGMLNYNEVNVEYIAAPAWGVRGVPEAQQRRDLPCHRQRLVLRRQHEPDLILPCSKTCDKVGRHDG